MGDGSAYCWGDNTYGQIGDGTTTNRAAPTLVSGGYTWASISTEYNTNDGVATTCGVTTAGAGYCWGSNNWGQVGDNTTTQRNVPTAVSGAHTWSSFTVGWANVCGLTTTGAGYCWGGNWFGQVGDSTTTERHVPTAVSGGYTWSSISEGWVNTCGVTTTGVGYCWGRNMYGTVGDNTTTERHVPTAVSGGLTWSSLSEGAADTCGVTTAGVGYCWGANGHGQIGDNTTTDQSVPTAVSGGLTWSSISEGDVATCGVTTAGVGYCWGRNVVGETGDSTTTERHVPTAVSGSLTFSSISAGADYVPGDTTCGITTGGVAYCWGYNNESQIGDGTTTDRHVPTEATLLFAVTDNVTASVIVDPTLGLAIAGHTASACGDASATVDTSGTPAVVNLGHVSATTQHPVGAQALTVTTNAANGYTVYISYSGPMTGASSGATFGDMAGTNASPASWPANGTEAFGYTTESSSLSGTAGRFHSNKWAGLSTTGTEVMHNTSTPSGAGDTDCIAFQASEASNTKADYYSTTVRYNAVASF